jgi:DNA (cytosine-5)-methyltransferase 1
MENVPGMARGGHAGILHKLIAEFEAAGYRFPDEDEKRHRILNAADFGVPQERNRLFLIGTREDQATIAKPPAPSVRPVPKRSTELPERVDSELPAGPTVWDAIGDLPNLNRFASLFASDATRLSHSAIEMMERAASSYVRRLRGLEDDHTDLSYPRDWDPQRLTSSMRTEHTEKSIRRFKATKPGETEPVSRYYKLDPDGLCNTLRAGSGSERGAFTSPRPLHPHLPRVLSNREAARLHSFPDWFRLHTTKWHGFRQIGNAVAPLVGRAVGRQVIVALNTKPLKPVELVALGDSWLLRLTMRGAAAHFQVGRDAIPPGRIRGAVSRETAAGSATELVAA